MDQEFHITFFASDSERVLKNVDFVVLGTGAAYMYPEVRISF